MAKIPALSALSALFAFPANPPVRPVDVVRMDTHRRSSQGGKYSPQPQTERNAFLRKDLPPKRKHGTESGEIGVRIVPSRP